jgi:hypothetical protein
MRKLLVLLVILAFVFTAGCACERELETPPEPVEPEPVPELAQIEPEEEEEVVAPPEPEEEEEEVVAPPEPEEEEETTIGTRVEGTEQEAVEEEVPEDVEEIGLLANKTMTVSEMTIPQGTMLAWKNYDVGWPHILAVESGKSFDTIRHARSDRLLDGEVWEYTFEEKGTFIVRDLFSGPMRMTVTVE